MRRILVLVLLLAIMGCSGPSAVPPSKTMPAPKERPTKLSSPKVR